MERVAHRLRRLPETLWLLARETTALLRLTWGMALLAIVLAISLWVYVSDEDDARRTSRVPGAIPVECVNVPGGKVPSPPCETETVIVRVRAPENVLTDLTASDFTATADLSDATSDTVTARVIVDVNEARTEIVEILPEQVTVRLEDVTSRSVPVRTRLVGAPPRGFETSAVTAQPQEAVISGAESLVARVAAVEADIDLTGVRTDFEQVLLLHPRDEQGGDLQNVNVEPESARVQVELVQLEFSAPFIVQPNISGTPAQGFVASGLQVDPPYVIVTGPAEIFQGLDPLRGLTTEPINIDGASADVARPVALRLPDGARVEQPSVTVRVIITRLASGTATPRPSATPSP